jgi:hypothetical protein
MSRRFQFSLRALLVAMLVVAAFFGGLVIGRQLGRREEAMQARREAVIAEDFERRWILKHFPELPQE